uniref:Retrovirus-related Pol polyprotein from transposon TNT 1-94 n=1 Tax=Tanacetum cinerariifolium TaxID=118510 RepID=A0A6L2M5L1_TANCI|nr:retrovirus-related Pol polyprotein from transposon TNT 1-94 [Tanacetum cinerariifolium]
METISNVQPSPTIPTSAEVIPQTLVPQDRWSREKHIKLVNIIGEPLAGIITRSRIKDSDVASASKYLYVNFLSEMEPRKLIKALEEEGWIISMQEELNYLHGFYGVSDGCEECIIEWENFKGGDKASSQSMVDTKPLAEPSFTRLVVELAKLFEDPEQSLIPPSKEVNVDDTHDKSLSRASVQPITQPKAPTDLKTNNKRIPSSSKPKSPYKVRVILLKKQVAETQHAKVTVAIADTTKSLVASKLVEEQKHQLLTAEAEKEEVKDDGFKAMEEVTFEQIMDEVDSKTQDVKEGDASESFSGLRSMPDDNLASISGFESQDSTDHVSEEDIEALHAFADKPTLLDPFGHLHAELGILNTKIDQLESKISKKVSEDMKSSVPVIVVDTLKEQLPGLLSDALKDTLPKLVKDFIKSYVSKSISEELPQVEAQQKSLKRLMLMGRCRRKNNLESPAKEKDAQHPDQTNREQDLGTTTIAIVQGEQPSAQVVPNEGQSPFVNEEKSLSIMPKPPNVTEASKMTLDQFTKHLSKTTSSIFSPTPPREPTPPRDSTKRKEEKKLGLPPPPALATFGMTEEEKKRKRTEILKEVFVTENITFDWMQRNLIPPPRVVLIEGLFINEPKSGIFFMNRNTNIAFQREKIVDEMFRKMIYVIEARSDCTKARETVEKNLDFIWARM